MSQYLRFIRQHAALLGFGFLAVFWGNFGQSFFVAWFGADIQRSLGMSAGTYGAAYSSATLLSAVAVVWLGGLIDRVALRRYVLAVSVGLFLAALVLSQARGLLSLLLGFFLLRLFGQALLPHTGITTMARFFSNNRGKALSVAMTGVPAGEIVLPLIAVALIAWLGWQATFLVVAASVLLLFLPLALWLLRLGLPSGGAEVGASRQRSGSADHADDLQRHPGRRDVLRDYRFWLALPALMASPFMITGIFIHQNFLVEAKGWTMGWLAGSFVLYGLVHWLSSLASGALVDRFRATRLLPLLQVPMLAALLVVAYMPGWWSAPVMMALLGVAAGGSPPVTGSMWPEIYGTRNLGSIRAMNMAIMVMATSISPVLFGYFIDFGSSVTTLFSWSALYVALAFVLMLFSYPANDRSLVKKSYE